MGPFGRRNVPFRRNDDGTYSINLDDSVRELLAQLVEQLRELLATDSPALARLFPPPYGDDEERNEGYAVLAGAELIEQRLAALDTVTSTLGEERIDEEQLHAWMRSLNDIRLVLGTILDVDEDHIPPDDPDGAQMFAVYEYLGGLLEAVVRALSD